MALVYERNPGALFRLGADLPDTARRVLFLALTVLAITLMVIGYGRAADHGPWLRSGLLFLISGALGNLIDRALFGQVVDFLAVGPSPNRWTAFNLADVFISTGLLMLVVDMATVFRRKKAIPAR